MRIDKGQALKMVARSGLSIVRSIVAFTLLGTLLSWTLLAFSYNDLGALCRPAETGAAPSAGFRVCAGSIGVGALLLIGFPIAFFLIGKAHGTQRALHSLYSQNRPVLASYLTTKLLDDMEKSRPGAQRTGGGGSKVNLALSYVRRLDNMPFGVRPIFRFLVRRIDVGGLLQRSLDATAGQQLGRPELEPRLAELVSSQLDQQVGERLEPARWPLWGVLATLALVFGYVEFVVG
jgi:hypothetical protein